MPNERTFKTAEEIFQQIYDSKVAENVEQAAPVESAAQPEATTVNDPAPTPQPTATPENVEDDFNFDLEDEPVAETQSPVTETPKFDFSTLVKDLGFEDIKDENDFKTRIKSLKEFEKVPDNLKKALDLSRKGGDWLSYLKVSQVDYNAIDPEQAWYQDAINNLGEESAKELWEKTSPLDRKLGGKRILNQAIQYQRAQQEAFEQEAIRSENEALQKRANADAKLKSTLDNLNEIAGIKLKPSQKQDIFEAITTGRMQKELFFDSKTGDYDFKNMVETYFVKKNLPKIISKIEQVTKSKTIKSVMKDIQNVQIDKPQEKPTPEVENKPAWQQYLDELNAKWKK